MSAPSKATTSVQRHGTWYSFDEPYQRLELFSPWTIAGFGVAVAFGLLIVYPHATLEQRLNSSNANNKPDILTVEYLKVFLKAQPSAVSLRFSLARQLIALGSYSEARQTLLLLHDSTDPLLRLEEALLELRMREAEAYAAKSDSIDRAQRLLKMRQQLSLLLTMSPSSTQLLVLARKALAAGDQPLAVTAYKQLAGTSDDFAPEIYAEEAAAVLGLGDFSVSHALYFRAMEHATTKDQRRQYFITALRTLQAGSLFDQAIDAADKHIGDLADDTQTQLFLIRLAQAANRLDAAERYVKHMLKLSLQDRFMDQPNVPVLAKFQTRAAFFAALARAESAYSAPVRLARIVDGPRTSAVPRVSDAPGMIFNDEAFTLSFNVFLANGNLRDARRVAISAVAQQPDNAVWRKRLAQVSEWDTHPQEALQQWLALARLTGDETAWNNALRIAEGVSDNAALTAILEHKIVSDPGNTNWLDRLLLAKENAGHPEEAMVILQRRLVASRAGSAGRRRDLGLLADLAFRAGRSADALAALRTLQAEYGLTSTDARRIALQLYRSGQPREAMFEMERAAASVPPDDMAFWHLYAELAERVNNEKQLRAGYLKLLAGESQTELELDSLITLLIDKQPLAAARVSEYAFAKYASTGFVLRAMDLRIRLMDWPAVQRLLQSLNVKQREALENEVQFLTLRAIVREHLNDLPGAQRDLRAALQRNPDDVGLRTSALWLMIAARDTESVKHVLTAWAHDAESNPDYWDAFAAANMSINRQATALHWFRRSGFRRDDYLWLLSYAECLEANSQPDLAWRLRHHAWLNLRKPEVLTKVSSDQLISLRDRLVGLSALFLNGDQTHRVMQAVLHADIVALQASTKESNALRTGKEMVQVIEQASTEKDFLAATDQRLQAAQQSSNPLGVLLADAGRKRPSDDASLSASVRELLLGYALNRQSSELAQAWFATRYADQLGKPLYAELSLMLNSSDRQGLNRLLDAIPDWLPMYDRIEAAQRAGRPALAQTMAFDQLTQLPHDEELHQRLVGLSTEQPANFSSSLTRQNLSPLQITEQRISLGIDLTPRLKMSAELIDRHQSSNTSAQLDHVPPHDRELGLTLRQTLEIGYVAVTVHVRRAIERLTGLRLEYNLTPTSRLSVSGSVGLRQLATESSLLRVGAVRDGIDSTLIYTVSPTEYLSTTLGLRRYASQTGTALGQGRNWNLEAGTHLRIEYPNLTLRAYASGTSFSDRGAVDATLIPLIPVAANPASFRILPQSDRVVGISLAAGTVVESRYSRGLRPYAEIGLTHSTVIGNGFNLRGGVVGSVIGQDMLRVRGALVSGTSASPQGNREIGIDYRWYFE